MSEERKSWEQMEEEPSLWFGRFTRYRLMAFGRSVAAVFHEEYSKQLETTRKVLEPDGTWYDIEKEWKWKERAVDWDAHWIEEQDKLIAQEREIVLRSGFAVQHRRIQSLDRILNQLIEMTEDDDKVWIPDVKSIGAGPNAYAANIVHFNAPLFTLIEKYKASIAAEMGERVKKTELTGKDGGPIRMERDPNLQLLTDEELAEAQRIASQLSSRQEGTE
jgi:hypothetical protein